MTQALSIRGLTKIYRNGVQALKGIDLGVEAGDFYALLGPNGAGKSTTIGIVTSLINKTAGEVRIFGVDIDRDFAHAKSMLGLVPQEFNFNVFEPVVEVVVNQAGYYGIPRREAFERAEQTLRQLGLWERRREMARNLSGGMKRRLMIARALVHRPRLLILDEPTAGVDIELRRSMWDFLREINKNGTTIILTTHYLEEAEQLCRHIAIINEGRLVADTNMKALLTQLQTETFVLDLSRPLERLPESDHYCIYRLDDCTLEVEIPKQVSLNCVFTDLDRMGVQILSMRNKANRLEELFVHLVQAGRDPAREDAA